MKIAIISFSLYGQLLGEKLEAGFKKLNEEGQGQYNISLATKSIFSKEPIKQSHQEWTEERFKDSDALIFIGATGIAVRSIAPYLRGKDVDPGVLVMDDMGKNVISLLSGHIGGANSLCSIVSQMIGANPVITTATDLHKKLSPDMLAKKNNLQISSLNKAKNVAAMLLHDEQIGVYSSFPLSKERGSGWHRVDSLEYAMDKTIAIGPYKEMDSSGLWLIPRCAFVGIGCRRNTLKEQISDTFSEAMSLLGLDQRAVLGVASIDLKKEEEGLVEFCSDNNFTFETFSKEELLNVEGDFTASDFVKEITGVDNVCERSALLAAKKHMEKETKLETPRLVLRKYSKNQVTVAIAMVEWRISIE